MQTKRITVVKTFINTLKKKTDSVITKKNQQNLHVKTICFEKIIELCDSN